MFAVVSSSRRVKSTAGATSPPSSARVCEAALLPNSILLDDPAGHGRRLELKGSGTHVQGRVSRERIYYTIG